jgi:hypothetical protein
MILRDAEAMRLAYPGHDRSRASLCSHSLEQPRRSSWALSSRVIWLGVALSGCNGAGAGCCSPNAPGMRASRCRPPSSCHQPPPQVTCDNGCATGISVTQIRTDGGHRQLAGLRSTVLRRRRLIWRKRRDTISAGFRCQICRQSKGGMVNSALHRSLEAGDLYRRERLRAVLLV